jgi:activating signal cointegrator 1
MDDAGVGLWMMKALDTSLIVEAGDLRCISILQPWATLWLLQDPDEKLFETRNWPTRHRGQLLVHAGMSKARKVISVIDTFASRLEGHNIHGIEDLTFGALIGRVELTACHKMSDIPDPGPREREVGFWSPERFAWERDAKPSRFGEPIPCRGSLRIFRVPAEVDKESLRRELS